MGSRGCVWFLLLLWCHFVGEGAVRSRGCPCSDPYWQLVEQRFSSSLTLSDEDVETLQRRGVIKQIGLLVDGKNTSDCIGVAVGISALLAIAFARRTRQLDETHGHLLGAAQLLPRCWHCFDASPWLVTAEEILNNYRILGKDANSCAWGVTTVDCLESLQSWAWTFGRVNAVPSVLLRRKELRRSPWKSLPEAVDEYVRWLHKGVAEEALYWKSFLALNVDTASGTRWVKPEHSNDWAWVDVCTFVDGIVAPRILNMGSGPIAPEPIVCDGRKVPIVSADGLADLYWRLYDQDQILPPVWPVQCYFEQASQCFGRDYFHVVHVRNALDHAFDAPGAVLELLAATRPGGVVVLHHARNEAENQGGGGMHRWSFDVDVAGRPLLKFLDGWTWDLAYAVSGKADVYVTLQDRADLPKKVMERDEILLITLRKHS